MAEMGEEVLAQHHLDIDRDDCLRLLSEGSFRVKPCRHCGNTDPTSIAVVEGFPGSGSANGNPSSYGTEMASIPCLRCTCCDRPYTLTEKDLLEASGEDAEEDLPVAGIECCNCRNKEQHRFSVTRYDDGLLHKITCLECHHGNTFHRTVQPETMPVEAMTCESGSDCYPEIECIKCPNTTTDKFDITYREDGRIHKITCRICGHGNTFHDVGLNDSTRNGTVVRYSQSSIRVGFWNTISTVSNYAWSTISPVAGQARNLVKMSANATLEQGINQVKENIKNKRPIGEGLRAIGTVQLASLGQKMFLQLGSQFLKRILPMIQKETERFIIHSLYEFVKNWAMQELMK